MAGDGSYLSMQCAWFFSSSSNNEMEMLPGAFVGAGRCCFGSRIHRSRQASWESKCRDLYRLRLVRFSAVIGEWKYIQGTEVVDEFRNVTDVRVRNRFNF